MPLPLDRIVAYEEVHGMEYKDCCIDIDERFEDIIGITFYEGRPIEKILLAVEHKTIDYIRTKPMHPSQTELPAERQENLHLEYPELEGYSFITIECIPNEELHTLIGSFGHNMIIISPEHIRYEIMDDVNMMSQIYSSISRNKQ